MIRSYNLSETNVDTKEGSGGIGNHVTGAPNGDTPMYGCNLTVPRGKMIAQQTKASSER